MTASATLAAGTAVLGLGPPQWVILLVGALVAASCSLLGTLLVLRRVAMLARIGSRRQVSGRFREQLILLHLKTGQEIVSMPSLRRSFSWSSNRLRQVISRLETAGLLEQIDDGVRLTERGARAIEATGTGPLAHRKR